MAALTVCAAAAATPAAALQPLTVSGRLTNDVIASADTKKLEVKITSLPVNLATTTRAELPGYFAQTDNSLSANPFSLRSTLGFATNRLNGEIASGDMQLQISWGFQIEGPAGSAPVKISALGFVDHVGGGSNGQSLQFRLGGGGLIGDPPQFVNHEINIGGDTPSAYVTFNEQRTLNLETNREYEVLFAASNYGLLSGLQGHPDRVESLGFDLALDFGAGFDRQGYAFRYSEGVAPPPPSTAVPEPATWALLILGFGAAGAKLRRRRVAAV